MASGERRSTGFSSSPCFAHELELSDDGYHIDDSTSVGDTAKLQKAAGSEQAMASIWLRRAYDEPEKTDGQRILVDRLWPRGLSKKALQLDGWLKDIAPSDDLRQWFGHDVDRWDEFKKRYTKELDTSGDAVKQLLDRLGNGNITRNYSAHAAFGPTLCQKCSRTPVRSALFP